MTLHTVRTRKNNRSCFTMISEIAELLAVRGWTEASGGNISIRLDEIPAEVNRSKKRESWPLPEYFPALGGNIFLVTVSRSRMREVAADPLRKTCIIILNLDGSAYTVLGGKGLPVSAHPTSELISHLAIHNAFVQTSSGKKTIVHCHPPELIALSHDPEITEAGLNGMLWSSFPEALLNLPHGIGLVPYLLPGSVSLASATISSLMNHDAVLWRKHGLVAAGASPDEAIDIIETAVNAARVILFSQQLGFQAEGISTAEQNELRKLFKQP